MRHSGRRLSSPINICRCSNKAGNEGNFVASHIQPIVIESHNNVVGGECGVCTAISHSLWMKTNRARKPRANSDCTPHRKRGFRKEKGSYFCPVKTKPPPPPEKSAGIKLMHDPSSASRLSYLTLTDDRFN